MRNIHSRKIELYGLVWTQFIADIFTVILTYAVYWKLYKEPQKKMRGS